MCIYVGVFSSYNVSLSKRVCLCVCVRQGKNDLATKKRRQNSCYVKRGSRKVEFARDREIE